MLPATAAGKKDKPPEADQNERKRAAACPQSVSPSVTVRETSPSSVEHGRRQVDRPAVASRQGQRQSAGDAPGTLPHIAPWMFTEFWTISLTSGEQGRDGRKAFDAVRSRAARSYQVLIARLEEKQERRADAAARERR